MSTRALVYAKTGQTITAGAIPAFSHASITAGQMYRALLDQDSNTTELGAAHVTAS
jgi:hypothetical protein